MWHGQTMSRGGTALLRPTSRCFSKTVATTSATQTLRGSDRKITPSLRNFGGLGAVAKPALDSLIDEITHLQRDWLVVADIFHKTVDIAYDERFQSKGGASISKAIDLCEIERTLPGHSQLRRAWSDFRDVAHLLAASAYLAHEGLNKAAVEASILKSIWIAPDAPALLSIYETE
jgi:hypothetical protein